MTSNASNASNESNQCCCICLEEENDSFENVLILYEHCGNYYVHNKCLNKWKYNECIICRKKIYNFNDEHNVSLNLLERNQMENRSNLTENNINNRNNQTSQANLINFSTVRSGLILSYLFLYHNYKIILKGCTFIVVCIVGMHYLVKYGNNQKNKF